jgi:hypothetical protein
MNLIDLKSLPAIPAIALERTARPLPISAPLEARG